MGSTEAETTFDAINGYLYPWYQQKITFGSLLSRLENQFDEDAAVVDVLIAYPTEYHNDTEEAYRDQLTPKSSKIHKWLCYVRAFEEWAQGTGGDMDEVYDCLESCGIDYDGSYHMGAGHFLRRLSKEILNMDVMQFAYIERQHSDEPQRIAVLLRSPWVNKLPDGWFEDQIRQVAETEDVYDEQ